MRLPESVRRVVVQNALNNLKQQRIDNRTNLHLHIDVLEAGDVIEQLGLKVDVPMRTAFVFVDLAPNRNWAHPCRWELYDTQTGKLYKAVDAHFPPSVMVREPHKFQAVHTPVKLIDTAQVRALRKTSLHPTTNALANAAGNRYAILFSGSSNNRHVNDMEFLYRTLIDIYGFAAANIYVLNYDGTLDYNGSPHPVGNWPGDSTSYRMVVTDAGTRAGMQGVLNTLSTRMQAGDLLFIHTNNHGAGPGDGVTDYCLCEYSASGTLTPYYVNDFVSDLGVLPAFDVLMVMMEQCRSGGFINPVINNSPARWTHICTAVQASDYSLGGADFDPFAEDWIAGITGQYADGTGLTKTVDSNSDGRIAASESFAYADTVHHTGDTPRADDAPAGYGRYTFLGLPAHDLFLRDNLQDHGQEPLIGGGLCMSPDIIVYNQELSDPEAMLCSPAVQDIDTLGEPVESGQDNYVYLRVQNRGNQPTIGTATVYWAPPSTLPTPGNWTVIGQVPIPQVAPREMMAVGPIVWNKAEIPSLGHYCFIGLIASGDDPAPDPTTIVTIEDYVHFIQESNNATWRNFDVQDVFKDSVTTLHFHVQGWPKTRVSTDLMIDLASLPSQYGVKLRLLKRLASGATLENAHLCEQSDLYQRYELVAGKKAYLRGLCLGAAEESQATLEITVPERTADGSYRIAVAQSVDGREVGRVNLLLAVGVYPYLANSDSLEVHVADCVWAARIAKAHKVAYRELDRALRHGFNGCRFCLPEYDTDRGTMRTVREPAIP